MRSARVCVIAINYFGATSLEGLAESLRMQSAKDWRLLVVDNSLDDLEAGRLRFLAKSDGRISIRTADENLGYFGGARFGLEAAVGFDYDWVVVCNTDLTFDASAIAQLCALPADGPIGVIGPSIVSAASGRPQNPFMRSRPSKRSMKRRLVMFKYVPVARVLVAFTVVRKRMGKGSGATRDGAERIYAAHGSCMGFSREYFRRGGSFDHPEFLFAEELSVAEACRSLQLDVIYDPSVKVSHAEHQATGIWRSRAMLDYQRRASRHAWSLLANCD